MSAAVHQSVAARLEEVDQRYTGNRRELVEILAGTARPLSIPEILDLRRGLAQSSIYRTLAVLEQAGAVRRVLGLDEFTRFELAEELTEHHHHLVCRECGSVDDFTSPRGFEQSLEKVISGVAAATGFTPDSHRLDLVGLCARCQGA